MVTLDDSTIVAAYVVHSSTVSTQVVRSVDNGATWSTPQTVSLANTYGLAIAGSGTSVDVAMIACENAGCGIRYRRSTDSGQTFSPASTLSTLDASSDPAVARGSDGTVAVAWYSADRGKIFIRVSNDGGTTFGPRVALWRAASYGGNYALAIGDGVIYAVAGFGARGIQVRRSFDGGATWTSSRSLGRYDDDGLAVGSHPHLRVSAAGDLAYVSWVRTSEDGLTPVYRRTKDEGASWSRRRDLAKPFREASAPFIAVDGAGAHATFMLRYCTTNACKTTTYYRQSADGWKWSARETVTEEPQDSSFPMGIGLTDRPVVFYWHYAEYWEHIAVRTRP